MLAIVLLANITFQLKITNLLDHICLAAGLLLDLSISINNNVKVLVSSGGARLCSIRRKIPLKTFV